MKKSILILLVILVLGFLVTINVFFISGVNSTKEKVSIVLYDDKYYEYVFPWEFIPFSGELKVKNDKLFYHYKYKDGYRNADQKVFYTNKQLKILAIYKDGHLEGKFIGWYENGQKGIETFYKKALETGKRIEWYENGAPKSITNFEQGKKNGEYIVWYDKGSMSKNEWQEKSAIKIMSLYKDGIEIGPRIKFDINGTIISKELKKVKL